jgi:hypothetical protein
MLLECNNCGAPLDVHGQPRIVQCRYCGASAALDRLRTLNPETPKNWQPPPHWTPQPAHGAARTQNRGVPAFVIVIVGLALAGVVGSFVLYGATAPGVGTGGSDGTCPPSFLGSASPLNCRCGSGSSGGSVWGTTIYTTDSSVCAAARHAGAISDSGGPVTALGAQGCGSYQGTTKNGVETRSWGRYESSFYFQGFGNGSCAGQIGTTTDSRSCPSTFQAGGAAEVRCTCVPAQFSGSLWGTDIYTTDSSICNAALHAGAVSRSGGEVTAIAAAGCPKYKGTARNGVTSGGWNEYGSSFYLKGHGSAVCK